MPALCSTAFSRRSTIGGQPIASDWFNNRRLLEQIGNTPPTEAVKRYYAVLDDTPMAA